MTSRALLILRVEIVALLDLSTLKTYLLSLPVILLENLVDTVRRGLDEGHALFWEHAPTSGRIVTGL